MARSIVVGTDGSKPADAAVRRAAELANREGARLHLVTAFYDPQILQETTVWTNEPKGVIDTGRSGGEPRTETVDLREVAGLGAQARRTRRREPGH